LKTQVTLEAIKTDAVQREMKMVRQSRLSVSPLTEAQAEKLLKLAGGQAWRLIINESDWNRKKLPVCVSQGKLLSGNN
jgi:hypothetical protein